MSNILYNILVFVWMAYADLLVFVWMAYADLSKKLCSCCGSVMERISKIYGGMWLYRCPKCKHEAKDT